MTAKQTPLVDILRLHAEDLYSDYGHNKSARLLSQAADEIERLRSNALALEDEKNDYMDGVGDVLGQDHDGETLWAAAQRVMSECDRLRARNAELLQILQNTAEALGDERDELRVMNAELLTDLDRVLKALRYLIGIAERGAGRPMADEETAESFVLGYVKRLEAELARKDEFCTRLAEVHEGAMKRWESDERECAMKACEMAAELKGLREEVERMRHDIERHIKIASDLATENERLRAELAKCKASLAAIYVMADRVSPGTIRDECIAAVPTILDALEGVK